VYVVVNNANSVVRIDARSAKVTRRVTLPDGLYACGALTLDGPIVWVTGCLENDRVARIDMRSGRVTGSPALRVYLGGGVVRGDVIWFSGQAVLPGGHAAFVGLDRVTATVTGRLRVDDTMDGSVAAFGSWWVAQPDGVARFRLEDLVVGRVVTRAPLVTPGLVLPHRKARFPYR
jgi:DNA-binding beta-propeller fold protein YncE